MRVYGIVLACVFCNVTAQILLKVGAGTSGVQLYQTPTEPAHWWTTLSSWPLLAGIALWTTSTLLWIYVLSGHELTFAYALYGLNYVLTPLAANVVFHETLKPVQVAGVALIALGVGLTVIGREQV